MFFCFFKLCLVKFCVLVCVCVSLPVNFFPLLVSFLSWFTLLPTCRVRMPLLRMLLLLL